MVGQAPHHCRLRPDGIDHVEIGGRRPADTAGRPRRASLRFKRPVHDVEANVSVCRVAKRLRHRGKYLESEGAPQPDRWRIGFDDRVELHRPVTVCAGLVKDAAAQRPACTLARRAGWKTKPALATCAPGPGCTGCVFALPITRPSSSMATMVRPGRRSHIHPARARGSVLAGSQVRVSPAVPSSFKISQIAGPSSAFASRVTIQQASRCPHSSAAGRAGGVGVRGSVQSGDDTWPAPRRDRWP